MNIIAIDIGGTRLKIGMVCDGKIIGLRIVDIPLGYGLSNNLNFIGNHIRELMAEDIYINIAGICVGFPGLVNTDKNSVIDTSKKYDDAPKINMVEWAKKEFGLVLRMENDARLACLGEWRFGAGQGAADMIMCTLGTGIGSAVIMDNKILKGKHFQAGILGGHFIVDYHNKLDRCSCGNYGCVEAMASGWLINTQAKRHPAFPSSELKKLDKIDLAAIFHYAATGDVVSIELREHCLNAWAVGIINMIHAYDPEVVVVGGGVMHSYHIIIPYLKHQIEKWAWCPSGTPKICKAAYPDTAALLGATLLFEQHEDEKTFQH